MSLPTISSTRARLAGGLVLVMLVLGSTWTVLGNQWVQDDIPIILNHTALHSFGDSWQFFATAYWPPPFPRDLYRPLTLVLLSAEWAIGGGSPQVFRLVSIGLYLLATIAVLRLALRLLPGSAAWVVAALFAVHPIHVEAVAVAVNQAELLVGLLLCGLVTAWIDRRRAGLSVTGLWGILFGSLYFAAMLIKEHAIVLPALLILLELSVLRAEGTVRLARAATRRLVLGAAAVVAVMLLCRDLALDGNTKGSFTAEAFFGLGLGGRALTMLGVVREWTRLLIWPEHLRADYSPQEIVAATSFGAPQAAGLLLLVIAIVVVAVTWRRVPLATFGIGWLAVSLAPVHNVLMPTGIVMAERTLFLGSVGFLLAIAALIVAWRKADRRREGPKMNIALILSLIVLLGCGMSRSASRQRVWHDMPTLWLQSLIDAPYSYRVHHAVAQYVFWDSGERGRAEWHYRRAMELHPRGWPVKIDLADKYRLGGECWPAMTLYTEVIAQVPFYSPARASLVACLLHVGEYRAAAFQARLAKAHGADVEQFANLVTLADSALRVGAPPGSVRPAAPASLPDQ